MGFLYENNKYKKTLALRLYLQIKKRLISFDRLGFQKCISNSRSICKKTRVILSTNDRVSVTNWKAA